MEPLRGIGPSTGQSTLASKSLRTGSDRSEGNQHGRNPMSTREAQQSEPAHPSTEPWGPRDDPPGRPRARPRITDADRASALRRMKRLATALFVFATIVFAVS